MLACPRIAICTILTLGGAEAFTSSGIFAVARPGGPFPLTARCPPPSSGSGSGTCVVGAIVRTAQGGGMDTRCRLRMKRRRGRDPTISVGEDDGRSAAATTNSGSSASRNVTKIEDGSPLGVAIVLLGGAWVVLGDGGNGGGSGADAGAQVSLPPFVASIASSVDGVAGNAGGGTGSTDGRIWAVFIAASVAAGISRLVRYYWNKK